MQALSLSLICTHLNTLLLAHTPSHARSLSLHNGLYMSVPIFFLSFRSIIFFLFFFSKTLLSGEQKIILKHFGKKHQRQKKKNLVRSCFNFERDCRIRTFSCSHPLIVNSSRHGRLFRLKSLSRLK